MSKKKGSGGSGKLAGELFGVQTSFIFTQECYRPGKTRKTFVSFAHTTVYNHESGKEGWRRERKRHQGKVKCASAFSDLIMKSARFLKASAAAKWDEWDVKNRAAPRNVKPHRRTLVTPTSRHYPHTTNAHTLLSVEKKRKRTRERNVVREHPPF